MKSQHILVLLLVATFASCKKEDDIVVNDPATASRVSIDRFSATAGHLFVRTGSEFPAANAPINMDQAPFITQGFGPNGEVVWYYNFDVQPSTPAPIWVLFKEGASTPVAGQLNIINVIPGEAGYNDFWQVIKVTVPDDYVANSVSSYAGITEKGYKTETTNMIVNCPVVPEGSTAALNLNSGAFGAMQGWYKDQAVFYFNFEEKSLTTKSDGTIPTSPIYVTFNINPDQPNGGPPSGFVTEPGTTLTHNVLATLPADAAYSPLWAVNMYDNAAFDSVMNLQDAVATPIIVENGALVNCPVVKVN